MTTSRHDPGGLYRPGFEKENCGFGLIAQMDGKPSHWLVKTAIMALVRLTHRGAVAADGKTGDGCGLLLNKPDGFLRTIAEELGFGLAPNYAVGMVFLNPVTELAARARGRLEAELTREGLTVLGWRAVPVDTAACGQQALQSLPSVEQVFVNAPPELDGDAFERRLYVARRRTEKAIETDDATFYIPSLSARVISYKGLVMPGNLPVFYQDLNDGRLESALCVFHRCLPAIRRISSVTRWVRWPGSRCMLVSWPRPMNGASWNGYAVTSAVRRSRKNDWLSHLMAMSVMT